MNLRILIFASVVPCLLTSRPLLFEEMASNQTADSKNGKNWTNAQKWFGEMGDHIKRGAHWTAVQARNGQYKTVISTMLKKPKSPPKPQLPKECDFSNSYHSPVTKMTKAVPKKHGGVLTKTVQKLVPILGVYQNYESVQGKVDELYNICATMSQIEDASHYLTQLQEFLSEKCGDSDDGQTVNQCTSSPPEQKPTTCDKVAKHIWEEMNMNDEQKATLKTNRMVNRKCLEKEKFLKPLRETLSALKDVQDQDGQPEGDDDDFGGQINRLKATVQEQLAKAVSQVKVEAEESAKKVEALGDNNDHDLNAPRSDDDQPESSH